MNRHTTSDPAPPIGATAASIGGRLDFGRVRPERLLARSSSQGFGPGALAGHPFTTRNARRVVFGLLERIVDGEVTVVDEDGVQHRFGNPTTDRTGPAAATVEVSDGRAWTALLREGSIGLGRGYIEGWWRTDDIPSLLRVIIRNLDGIDELRNRINLVTGRFGDAARRILPRSDRRGNREEIAAHYDLGNDFFRLFLDETMTYSSGVFVGGVRDLRQASVDKYDRLLAKLRVGPEHDLLEIGTGWGGLALRAAGHHGCMVTTTTVSAEQLTEAKARTEASGLDDRIEVLNRDWRDLGGRFDRIISIEMIEAVDWRDYDRFFATIERCLAPDGLVGLQAICVPDRRYERTKNTEDFIRRFVFPGGFLPSIGAIGRAVSGSTRLQLIDVEDLSAHYAETLNQWRTRFDNRLAEARALGLDDRFCRLWRFYLAYCEAGFLERHCTVNQLVLAGPEWRPAGLELRPG